MYLDACSSEVPTCTVIIHLGWEEVVPEYEWYWEAGNNSLDTAWCFPSYVASQNIILNQEALLLSIVHLLKKKWPQIPGEEVGRFSAWNYLPCLYTGKRWSYPKQKMWRVCHGNCKTRNLLIFIEAGKDGKIILFLEEERSKNLKFSLVYNMKLEVGQFID